MKKKTIYYIFPDYVEDAFDLTAEDDVKKLINEGKGECYDLENFILAFNDETISDMGYLFAF
jgi:hypothetical protein